MTATTWTLTTDETDTRVTFAATDAAVYVETWDRVDHVRTSRVTYYDPAADAPRGYRPGSWVVDNTRSWAATRVYRVYTDDAEAVAANAAAQTLGELIMAGATVTAAEYA